MQLQIQGRFETLGGPGDPRDVIGKLIPDALYSVTTRTVSAGADLSITWYMNKQFSNGPQEYLALLTLWSGIAGTLIITAFIAFFIQRNQTITKRVHEATGELMKVSEAVEQSPVSVVITDKNGTIEYVNPTFSQVTGYTADEAIGQNPSVLKSGDLPESFYKDLWDTILSGNTWRGEFANRKKSGEEFWETASISSIKNEEGEITHFVAVKEDITEQKKIRESLRESEIQLRTIFHNSPLGILYVGKDGTILDCNEKHAELMGSTLEKQIGVNLLKELTDDEVRAVLLRAISGEKAEYEGEYASIKGRKTRQIRTVYNPTEPGNSPTEVIITT